jgi:acetolactate synthase I/II/III large subunit
VAISGDGGFLFNAQELATAVAHKINAVVIVFNDNAFGNVMRDQRDRFQGRVYGGHWFSLMGTILPFEITTYAI